MFSELQFAFLTLRGIVAIKTANLHSLHSFEQMKIFQHFKNLRIVQSHHLFSTPVYVFLKRMYIKIFKMLFLKYDNITHPCFYNGHIFL